MLSTLLCHRTAVHSAAILHNQVSARSKIRNILCKEKERNSQVLRANIPFNTNTRKNTWCITYEAPRQQTAAWRSGSGRIRHTGNKFVKLMTTLYLTGVSYFISLMLNSEPLSGQWRTKWTTVSVLSNNYDIIYHGVPHITRPELWRQLLQRISNQ